MTSPHPLLIVASVLVGAVVVPRLFPRWPLWALAVWRVTILVLLAILVQRIIGSPLLPHFHSESSGQLLWEQLVEAGWWAVGAQGAIALVRLIIVLENRPRETQIISDLIAGAIYVSALLAIINFAFAVPIGGLLATSGVIAIVLGRCEVAEHCWDPVGLAIVEYAHRFPRLITVSGQG